MVGPDQELKLWNVTRWPCVPDESLLDAAINAPPFTVTAPAAPPATPAASSEPPINDWELTEEC